MFVEYNHADFGTNSGTFNSPVLGPVTLSAKSDVDLVLFGLNWRLLRVRWKRGKYEENCACIGVGCYRTELGGCFVGKGKAPAPVITKG